MKKFLIAALAGVAAASVSTAASAADFSFTGTFLTDDAKKAFEFSLASASTITIRSFGYAGGTNAAGQSIAAGGFDGVLSLYDATGQFVGGADDGITIDPVSGRAWDPILSQALAAGTYRVYLTQYDNFGPANLAQPFIFEGQPNFRSGFVDFDGFQRTGNWALDISGVQSAAAVPEPETWALMLIGFGTVGVAMRRRRRVAVSFG